MNHLRTAALAVIAFLSLFLGAPYSKAQSPVVDSINFKGATNIFVSHHGVGNPASSCTGIFKYIQDDDTTGQPIWICQAGTMVHAAGGGNPAAINYAINFSNLGHTAFQGDAGFTFNPLTHTFASTENAVINALSSTPRAIYDPMDTSYDGGLAAAIAGTSGYSPTQVIQAAEDFGECQVLTGVTVFDAIEIPLPSGVTIPIGGIKLWSGTSIGGDSVVTGPMLQHNDATQPMISGHGGSDTITCNGHSYNPGGGVGVGGILIHDFSISGMGPQNTNTDVGIEMNMESSAAVDIRGGNDGFGAAAVISNGTSTFLQNMGQPGSQMKGCMTYNGGVLPVAGFSLGGGRCASVMDSSLDGGMGNVYATDGQVFSSGHSRGPC